jgi:uncharacterized protein (TIGR04255 family)
MGFGFMPVPQWNLIHYGLFWQAVRDDYPTYEVLPPVPSMLDDSSARQMPMILTGPPPVRCWFIAPTPSRLLQIQNDRLMLNWRRMEPSDEYPRYRNIRPQFERDWTRFREFLQSQEIPPPEVKAWEVTYVNHVEKGKGWEDFSQLSNVLRCWSPQACGDFLPQPDGVSVNMRFTFPEGPGRLTIEAQPAVRIDGVEIIQISLTARGRPSSQDSLFACLDRGREWVVNGFDSVTTDAMHTLWGRIQ